MAEPRELRPFTNFSGPTADRDFSMNVERVTHKHEVATPDADMPRQPAPDAEPVPTPETPTPRPDGEPPSPDHVIPAEQGADLLQETIPNDLLEELGA